MQKQTPLDRLNYSGDIKPIIERLCKAYGVGQPEMFRVIEFGYEDCNVVIKTGDSKYVAKIFSKIRSPADIERYAAIMKHAREAGVNHPELMLAGDEIVFTDNDANGISMVLARFIEGSNFLELDRAPDNIELRKVLEQAALVNSIQHIPPYLFDSWAIPNIRSMMDRVRQFISLDDMKLVGEVISKYERIPVGALPHCFVHGDFTKTNVMRGDDGEIYILDFSVSNWYPRIQEIAVIIANLMHDKGKTTLREKTAYAAYLYNEFNPLTEPEQKYLHDYALAGIAMEFMGAHQEKFIKGNDNEETDYWLELGREGLRKALK